MFFSVFCIDVKETGVWYNEKQEFDEGGDTLAKHEFGIMQIAPEKGKRYDEYEPQKYDCISVDDGYLEDQGEELGTVDLVAVSGAERSRLLYYLDQIQSFFQHAGVKLIAVVLILLLALFILRKTVLRPRSRYGSRYSGRRRNYTGRRR